MWKGRFICPYISSPSSVIILAPKSCLIFFDKNSKHVAISSHDDYSFPRQYRFFVSPPIRILTATETYSHSHAYPNDHTEQTT